MALARKKQGRQPRSRIGRSHGASPRPGGGTSRRYVTNKMLGVKRPPNAFSLFLNCQAGKLVRPSRSRLVGKTGVFRMDLLKLKFSYLSKLGQTEWHVAAAAALAASRLSRREALCSRGNVADHDAKYAPREKQPVVTQVASLQKEQPSTALPGDPTAAATVAPAVVAPAVAGNDGQSKQKRVVWIDPETAVSKQLVLGAILGSGTCGHCFKAVDSATAEMFCLKFPRDRPEDRLALHIDIQVMAALSHPNLFKALGVIQRAGTLAAMVAPLMGCDLWQFIHKREEDKREGAAKSVVTDSPHVTFSDRSFLVQLAAGVAHMHVRFIFHLDVKPDNILLSESGVIQLADFGNAQSLKKLAGVPFGHTVYASEVNAVGYRPLELLDQSCKVPLSRRFDLWAMGVVTYDLCQSFPRSRNSAGKVARLMSDVNLAPGEADLHLAKERFDLLPKKYMVRDALKVFAVLCSPRGAPLVSPTSLDMQLRNLAIRNYD